MRAHHIDERDHEFIHEQPMPGISRSLVPHCAAIWGSLVADGLLIDRQRTKKEKDFFGAMMGHGSSRERYLLRQRQEDSAAERGSLPSPQN